MGAVLAFPPFPESPTGAQPACDSDSRPSARPRPSGATARDRSDDASSRRCSTSSISPAQPRSRHRGKDEMIATVWAGESSPDSTLASRSTPHAGPSRTPATSSASIRTYHEGRAFRRRSPEEPNTRVHAKPPNPATDEQRATRGKACIAVLPFVNLSGDAQQEYFSDGITEDIITELSRNRSLAGHREELQPSPSADGAATCDGSGATSGRTTSSKGVCVGSAPSANQRAALGHRGWSPALGGALRPRVAGHLPGSGRNHRHDRRSPGTRGRHRRAAAARRASPCRRSTRGTSFVSARDRSTNRPPTPTARRNDCSAARSSWIQNSHRLTASCHMQSCSA